MNEAAVLEVGREAMWVIIKLSGPVMLAGMAIGLIIALFQALTTIQEMTLTFVPKILVVFFTIIVMLPFMMNTITEFGQMMYERIAHL